MNPEPSSYQPIRASYSAHLRPSGWPTSIPAAALIAGLLLALASANASSAPPTLPDGWRYATAPEIYQESSHSQLETYVSGDLDGDNIGDHAAVVITTDNTRQELIVRLSSHDDGGWLVLDSLPFIDSVSMGLGKVPPGKQRALCETDEECLSADKKEIVITKDAINYFRPESASSIFIYHMGTFNRIWQSD